MQQQFSANEDVTGNADRVDRGKTMQEEKTVGLVGQRICRVRGQVNGKRAKW